jgi:hypothetical protein
MTSRLIEDVLRSYSIKLLQWGYPAEQNAHANGRKATLAHCHWMCQQAEGWADVDREKAMRWLCFVQGCLHCYSLFTVNEMREHNKGILPLP